jgi:opacity protein-like surface antigen
MKLAEHAMGLAAALTLWSAGASAQTRFDVGLLLGSTRTTDEGSVLQFDRGTTYQATFAWDVWRGDSAKLSIEVPFIASNAFTIITPGSSLPLEYASLYLTPGARVTVMPEAPVSVFGSIGAGYARYSESKLRADRSANPGQRDTNAGALQFGAGVDVRGFGWLGFRGEVRDVYTGARNFSIPVPGPKVHNVIVSGGLVVRL